MNWKDCPRRNLWQHPVWEAFQKKAGRATKLLRVEGAQALCVLHKLPFSLTWVEVPRGPLFSTADSLDKCLDEVMKWAKKEGAVFARISPYDSLPTKHEARATKHDRHPETSLIIDLKQSEEEILKQMKPKGRYNIKVAQKHGVRVSAAATVNEFHNLLLATGSRDGFGIHPKSYYQAMLDVMPKNAQLLIATHDGQVIAGGLFVYLDEWGIYYYGASDNQKRNLMAPYLLQWEAMKEAKKRNCKHFDLLGIAPENAKNHPWAGVTRFKKQFGGRVVHYPQAKDLVLRPLWYAVYRFYKKLR